METKHVVRKLNKDGQVSRMRLTSFEKSHNCFTDPVAAETRRAEMERLNPGTRYIVSEESSN